MPIKGQGRFNVFVAKRFSASSRNAFLDEVMGVSVDRSGNSEKQLSVRIFSFSGRSYFNEQLYSILQFLHTVGSPKQWLVVNDGTYSEDQKKQLEQFPFVTVVEFDWIKNDKFRILHEYSAKHVWAKIFYAYLCLLDDLKETTIYLEADVLVFSKFNYYLPLFNINNWYLADTGPHFDQYYLNMGKTQMFDVNNGFAIYNHRPDIEVVYNYLVDRFKENNFEYFTPQSAMQLMIEQDSFSRFLDPRYFVVNCSDHFKIGIDHDESVMALRHFVGPVRHKMWQYSWKKVLHK